MTPSKSPSLSSDNRSGAASESSVLELLRSLCGRPGLHARFLNTLSLMEHIGSRKILLTMGSSPMGAEVLRHLSEETRHALFFRRAAEKVGLRPVEYASGDLLAPGSARMYMGRLDATLARRLDGDTALAYRYVTLAVELRAAWFYGLYERTLRETGASFTLSGVLKEDAHLAEMQNALSAGDPRYADRKKAFAAVEGRLFGRWLAAVRAAADQ